MIWRDYAGSSEQELVKVAAFGRPYGTVRGMGWGESWPTIEMVG